MYVSDWHRRVQTAVIGLCVGGGGSSDLTACSDPWQHSFQMSFYYLLGWKREDERGKREKSQWNSKVWRTEPGFMTTGRLVSLTECLRVCGDVTHIDCLQSVFWLGILLDTFVLPFTPVKRAHEWIITVKGLELAWLIETKSLHEKLGGNKPQ